jgi:hypothetical protein
MIRVETQMIMPSAVAQQANIEAEVRAVEAALRRDIVRIRYEIGEDWSGQWAIFFRVVLSDDAAKHRLRQVTTNVAWRLAERLDFQALGVFPYHNFRSDSEQAALREEAWA